MDDEEFHRRLAWLIRGCDGRGDAEMERIVARAAFRLRTAWLRRQNAEYVRDTAARTAQRFINGDHTAPAEDIEILQALLFLLATEPGSRVGG